VARIGSEMGPEVGAAVERNQRAIEIQGFVMDVDRRRASGDSSMTPAQGAELLEATRS
jgi:hypothetical protein